jgi:nucleoside-diphosphate-sugar epimerase
MAIRWSIRKKKIIGQRESDRPRGVYDEAKRFAEALTMAYHRYHGVQTRIVRIFNTYGPRMRAKDGRVVPRSSTSADRRGPDDFGTASRRAVFVSSPTWSKASTAC